MTTLVVLAFSFIATIVTTIRLLPSPKPHTMEKKNEKESMFLFSVYICCRAETELL